MPDRLFHGFLTEAFCIPWMFLCALSRVAVLEAIWTSVMAVSCTGGGWRDDVTLGHCLAGMMDIKPTPLSTINFSKCYLTEGQLSSKLSRSVL